MPELDDVLETDALALSRLWTGIGRQPDASLAALNALVEAAIARGDPRIAALNWAWEAVHLVYMRTYEPDVDSRLDALSAQVDGLGWPRAQALLSAARAYSAIQTRNDLTLAAEQLAGQGPAESDPRPPAERFWTDAFSCIVHGQLGQFDAALQAGLVADRLAGETGFDWCISAARQALAFTFLSMGDVQSAAAVLPHGIAAEDRMGHGRHRRNMRYNLLLSLAMSGEFERAQAVIDANPSLLDRDFMDGNPLLRCMAAYLRSWQGRDTEALALLELDAHPPEASSDVPGLAANRAWMNATVWHRAGQTARAHAALQAFFAHSTAQGWQLSMMNTTQLMRVLSEVREAQGDLAGALDALKRSQEACFQWVAGSMRVRLKALHLQSPARHADASRLTQRLEVVAQASAATVATSARGAQSRFLAHVTHELRNPLNSVIGMTSLLALSELDDRQRRYVEVMESSAQMLLALCNDTLDLAKIEAGKFDLNPQSTDVGGLLREAVRMYEHQVQRSSVALLLDVDPALPPRLVVDRLRLQQVLMNLLANAAKFTRRGSITVEAWWWPTETGPGGRLHVAVTDTGPGLDATQCERLFQEFSQADGNVAQHHGGTGLGLALCRSLVELMGGRIDVDSAPGRGSSFWFELPLAAAQA